MGVRHAVVVAGLLGLLATVPALAQAPRAITPAPERWGLFTNYNVHIGIETVSGDDPRFQFDMDAGGDLDIWDYVRGRVNTAFNYEAILGEEYQPFDPNQGTTRSRSRAACASGRPKSPGSTITPRGTSAIGPRCSGSGGTCSASR